MASWVVTRDSGTLVARQIWRRPLARRMPRIRLMPRVRRAAAAIAGAGLVAGLLAEETVLSFQRAPAAQPTGTPSLATTSAPTCRSIRKWTSEQHWFTMSTGRSGRRSTRSLLAAAGLARDPDGQWRPELRAADDFGQTRVGPGQKALADQVAEDARFELARGCPQHAFQACALGH
jgi:hypothetical protein